EDSLVRGVASERLDHAASLGVARGRARRGQEIVIGGREAEIGAPDPPPAAGEPPERGGRALGQQMAVDVEQHAAPRALGHHVPGPDFLEHRARAHPGRKIITNFAWSPRPRRESRYRSARITTAAGVAVWIA